MVLKPGFAPNLLGGSAIRDNLHSGDSFGLAIRDQRLGKSRASRLNLGLNRHRFVPWARKRLAHMRFTIAQFVPTFSPSPAGGIGVGWRFAPSPSPLGGGNEGAFKKMRIVDERNRTGRALPKQ